MRSSVNALESNAARSISSGLVNRLGGGPASGLISTHLVTLICCLQVSALQRVRSIGQRRWLTGC